MFPPPRKPALFGGKMPIPLSFPAFGGEGRAKLQAAERNTPVQDCPGVSMCIYFAALFAVSTRAEKLFGSWIAISESIFRFSSMPLFFRPFMKTE